MSPASARGKPQRRRRAWKRWVLFVLLGVFALLAFRTVKNLRAEPEYWQANRAFLETAPPEDLERLARDIQIRAPREWTRPVGAGDGQRTLAFGFDEVNAWLALKLQRVLRNQGVKVPGLAGAMVTERDGQIVAAVSQDSGQSFRVFSLFFDVTHAIDATGAKTQEPAFRLAAIRMGNQSVPVALIAQLVDPTDIKDPAFREIITQLAAGEAVGPLTLPVGPHRSARVQGFRATDDGVELDVQVDYTDPDRAKN